MHYVYLMRSQSDPRQTYLGSTANLRARVQAHNDGHSPHTSKFRPWRLNTYLAFSTKLRTLNFEAYLKSPSGKAFVQKRLWPRAGAGLT